MCLKTMEFVVDGNTASGLMEAEPHPVNDASQASELGEGVAGVFTNNKGNVNPKSVKPVKQDASNVCKSSVMTRKCTCIVNRYVHAAEKGNSSSTSQFVFV